MRLDLHRIRRPIGTRRGERGTVMVYVLAGLIPLIGFASLSIDLGLAYNSRTQAQAAVDAAALSAAANMIDKTGPSVTLAASQTVAVDIASQNGAYPNASLVLDPADLTFGQWDVDTRTLQTGVDLGDPDSVTGVQAVLRLDDGANQSVPAYMSRILGRDQFSVQTAATAYLGFAGSAGPGDVELPIAVPCCVLNGPNCDQDYCASGEPMPNSCALNVPQPRGDNTVSCLQFHNTADQTACWTQFDSQSPSVNTSNLVDIIEHDLGHEVSVDDSVYLDNGDKTPVVSMLFDRFYGEGPFTGNPSGNDTDGDGLIDSWITRLPVVECQDSDHCAKGLTADIVGIVCVEIREVTVTPDKMVRAQFLCPDLHPTRFQQCSQGLGPTGTGGLDYGIRADIPVLVQ